jgi:hypothetical protein
VAPLLVVDVVWVVGLDEIVGGEHFTPISDFVGPNLPPKGRRSFWFLPLCGN